MAYKGEDNVELIKKLSINTCLADMNLNLTSEKKLSTNFTLNSETEFTLPPENELEFTGEWDNEYNN